MRVREPAVAGQFYPGNPETLRQQVHSLLRNVKVSKLPDKIYGLIVPHAGYDYSGQTAAYAFKQLELVSPTGGVAFNTVILIGPAHRVTFRGAGIYPSGKWRTPLGDVEIDSEFASHLLSQSKSLSAQISAHEIEHSLEVELPFLQIVLKEFKLVPICIGDQSFETCKQLADTIVGGVREPSLQGRKVLLISSSDFYHGYSYDECKRSLATSVSLISQYKPEEFHRYFIEEGSACGGGAIVTTMLALNELGAKQSLLLHATNSQDVTGVPGYVVGYASFVFTNTGFSKDEKKLLLEFARNAITSAVINEPAPTFKPPKSQNLTQKRGCFVTIKTQSKLRGCIGYILPVKPLYQAVRETAVEAAMHDQRFHTLTQDELPDIKIEISVLTELQRVHSIEEIQVGRDGLYIKRGTQSGLLLPQVAIEEGWNTLEFIEQTCFKAGLHKDAWKEAEIYKFQAEIFGDE